MARSETGGTPARHRSRFALGPGETPLTHSAAASDLAVRRSRRVGNGEFGGGVRAREGNPRIGPHDRGLGLQDWPNSLSIASRKIALRRV